MKARAALFVAFATCSYFAAGATVVVVAAAV